MTDDNFSLINRLEMHVQHQPGANLYSYIQSDLTITQQLSYQLLLERVQSLGNHLKALTKPGDRVVVALSVNADFIVSFLACLYAGVIAVPSFPPLHFNASLRFKGICEDAEPSYILSNAALAPRFAKFTTPLLEMDRPFPLDTWSPRHCEIAFLQYTSGSTGNPKGVIITQQNLDANLKMINDNFGHSQKSVGFIWLPPFHDMGLIGGVLQPLYVGFPVYLLPPQSFLQDPLSWLKGISQFKATTSGGPNFAYGLVTELLNQLDGAIHLDLSSWEVAFNGSEPIHIETMQQFIRAANPFGFRAAAVHPCYGLAEATLFVTGKPKLTQVKMCSLETSALLAEGHTATLIDMDAGNPKNKIVSSGAVAKQVGVQIHHPETHERLPGHQIGEIWVSGPAIAQGYWNNHKATEENFIKPDWFKTGDLGCLIDNELLVTGRLKDLIIYHGVNHYPQDIEHTATHSHPALGSAAAFSVCDAAQEQLIVIVELKSKKEPVDSEALFKCILTAIAREHEIPVHQIILINARTLAKTTSGKIARSANRQLWQNNQLSVVAQWQINENKPISNYVISIDEDIPLLEWLQHYLESHLGKIPDFSMDLSFAELGLDSILIYKLSADLSRFLKRPIDAHIFWEVKTVGEMLAALEPETQIPLPLLPTEISNGPLPLSPNEEWLWQLLQKDHYDPVYTICVAVEINGEWNKAAFEKAWKILIDHESSLRSYFLPHEGTLARWIAATTDWTPTITDAMGVHKEVGVHKEHKEEELHTFLLNKISALKTTTFNYSAPSQFAVEVILLAPNQWLIGLAISHLITDGASISLLLPKFMRIYHSIIAGEPPPNLEKEPQYAHYALWHQQLMQSHYFEPHQKFWHEDAKNWTIPNLPRPKALSKSFQIDNFELTHQELSIIKEKARTTGFSLHTYMLSSWLTAIKAYFPSNKVTLKLLTASRTRAQTAKMQGFLANELIFSLEIPDTLADLDLLHLAQEKFATIMRYQDYPVRYLRGLKRAAETHDFGESIDFPFIFNWHNYNLLAEKTEHFNMTLRRELVPDHPMWNDGSALSCNLYVDSTSMQVQIKYLTEIFSQEQVDELLQRFLARV